MLDEVTVDLDVVSRMDLLEFFCEECDEVNISLNYLKPFIIVVVVVIVILNALIFLLIKLPYFTLERSNYCVCHPYL